jgi:hypothetical protein
MKLKNKVGIRKKVSLGSKVAQKNCSTFTAILTGGGPWKLVEYNRKRREREENRNSYKLGVGKLPSAGSTQLRRNIDFSFSAYNAVAS